MAAYQYVYHMQGVSKTYPGGKKCFENIHLSFLPGVKIGVVGVNGAGKSTLMRIMAGLDTDFTGEAWSAEGAKVGYLPQEPQLDESLNARENVMLPLELAGIADAREKSEDFLSRVGLGERFNHYPRTLSGGEQQRVAIARAFASQPLILFADEPTGNLDTTTGATVVELLFGLNKEEGTTLVLVTHDNGLADRCQRKFAMTAGHLEEVS